MAYDVKSRDSALRAIKRYMLQSCNNDLEDCENISSLLTLLQEQWVRFTQAQDAIESACGNDIAEIEENNRIQAESWYSTALANLNRKKNTTSKSNMEPSFGTAVGMTASIKLPRMELPSFSGESTEWISFHDAFKSLVDSNNSLTNGQKLHYLRSCLKGEAFNIISSFKICDSNYDEAWDLVNARYKVMRIIVDGHFRALFAISKTKDDSAAGIKLILDTTLQHTRALKALGRPVQFWDDWLVHMVVGKLAVETRKQWELSLINDEPPTFEQLKAFLETRCRSLAMLSSISTSDLATFKNPIKNAKNKTVSAFHALEDHKPVSFSCFYCNGDHKIYDCQKFASISINDRFQSVKDRGACLNCLSIGHHRSKCRSNSNCRTCNRRHHTLIHVANEPKIATHVNADIPARETSSLIAAAISHTATTSADTTAAAHATTPATTTAATTAAATAATTAETLSPDDIADTRWQPAVLLATAVVNVRDHSGRWQTARLLFDSGSHASFVTNSCVQRLRISRKSSMVLITGIGAASGGRTKGETTLTLSPLLSESQFKLNVLILTKITNDLPTTNIQVFSKSYFKDLPLADPHFMKSGPIDILIGMDQMCQFLTAEIRKGAPGTLTAQNTVFGWILYGCINTSKPEVNSVETLFSDVQLVKALSRLWELQEAPNTRHLTAEEKFCEDHFDSTVRRAADGRFIVELPLKPNITLGESRTLAIRHLLRLEKRFLTDEGLRSRYKNFMDELIQMNHMEPVSESSPSSYYMPHHAVMKETSATTKLRVVFNASAKSSSGYSLNDALMVGPQLQQELHTILLRFRTHRFGLCADIAKMYRQVCVAPKHVNLQRIVWRADPSQPIQDYRMLRVTYGVSAASHLAVKALQQTAKDSIHKHKTATGVILRDFYMDDLLTGASSVDELKFLQNDISELLSGGGFELRQWASNCEAITSCMASSSKNIAHYLADGKEVHTLGIMWNTEEDSLTFDVNLKKIPVILTKRAFLSDASTLFDPLGLLSPCVIRSKIWFQEIWRTDADWDDAVPDAIARDWFSHRKNLLLFSKLKLNRWLGTGIKGSYTEIHVFADASERAYAAVAYARTTENDGAIVVSLISSKVKVAPLKSTTLPRLELCAAHLATKLVKSISASWDSVTYPVFAWTDSTIALAWLQAHPSRWATFIANRVAETQDVIPPECWHHVRSEHNPADCASRGVAPDELLNHTLWWNGPSFLRASDEFWKHNPPTHHTTELEMRSKVLAVHIENSSEQWDLMTKYSSFSKLKRVTAYMLRFINNMRVNNGCAGKRSGCLSCKEISEAEMTLIKYNQNFYFFNEISHCSARKQIPKRSSLLRLQPFLDKFKVLRVGGRLRQAKLSNDVRHPIILAKNSPLARLIILEIHRYTLHAGPQIMQVVLQRRFWVVGARNLIRKVYRKCVKCTLLNRKVATQSMSDLPSCRTTYARCFLQSAVDFAGPYAYKFSNGRGAKSTKGYICVFICMGTGAMHLELVSDLTSTAFLNSFKRFINRRGYCKSMYSDNGTNFVGAEKELRKMFMQCMAQDKLRSFFAESSIAWHFNPPSAPHMGGYWEVGVKRVKYHLKRVLGDSLLSYEEFITLLTEIEACVNSRPLCACASDASDLEILTPGHFILGEPIKSLPEPEVKEFAGSLHQRWHVISTMRQHFWRRWSNEYLLSLQRRVKWFRPSRNIEVNDVVAITNDIAPPTKWKLARVVKCHPGPDGRVRVVTLKTSNGELVRPVVKLCQLPTKCDIFTEDKID